MWKLKNLTKKALRLEIDITNSISSLLDDFKSETGYVPYSITIPLYENRQMFQTVGDYILGKVEVEFKLR